MRTYLHIDLASKSVERETWSGEQLARAGRYYIAKTLWERGIADIDPLSPENPLIISAGPFAGTNFSNANRTSVGCKSPLTGGVKESNAGGSFSFALGQIEICGLTLDNASDDWVVIRITKDGEVAFHDGTPYLGLGTIETGQRLFETYGDKIAVGICGPISERLGLMGGISFSDPEGRPVRIAARGGVGAVMGSKKVKAIVVDKHKMPTFVDRKKFMGGVKEYGAKLSVDPAIKNMSTLGTAMVADIMNLTGGIPVRNFSAGQMVDPKQNRLKLGGDFIREQNLERGGETTHACMPGCMIQCSNVYADKDGKELVSPLEYETIGLLGTNCGLSEPDDVARLNHQANDLGIDTIELGATLAILMHAGHAKFGDVDFMAKAIDDIREGNERGRMLMHGTAFVGDHFGIDKVPVIKRQAISAYDPRVIEVTGISMMSTAQGADHTTGNLPTMDCTGKSTEDLVAASLEIQMLCAAVDSIGLCVFGRSVTNINHPMVVQTINDALGTTLPDTFLKQLGLETLALESAFNEQAGFTIEDDELPKFFYGEALPPTQKQARHHAREVREIRARWLEKANVEMAVPPLPANSPY